jgi:L-threonylcarbamoyladenylate synthase
MIAAATGVEVTVFQPPVVETAPESLPSPGVGLRHYAPRARLLLVPASSEGLNAAAPAGRRVGVLLPEGWIAPPHALVFAWGPWEDQERLAQRLFAGLRALDAAGVEVILCPVPEGDGVAAALRDRLEKAARPE